MTGRHLVAVLAGLATVYLAATAVLVAVTASAFVIGWRPHLVLSGSMRPSLSPGDLILVAPANPGRYFRPGDVITFRASKGTVTHRVVDARVVDGGASYATKGDANRMPDARRVEHTEVIGIGRAIVPLIGRPVLWFRRFQWLPLTLWLASLAVAHSVRQVDRMAVRQAFPAGRPAVAEP